MEELEKVATEKGQLMERMRVVEIFQDMIHQTQNPAELALLIKFIDKINH